MKRIVIKGFIDRSNSSDYLLNLDYFNSTSLFINNLKKIQINKLIGGYYVFSHELSIAILKDRDCFCIDPRFFYPKSGSNR